MKKYTVGILVFALVAIGTIFVFAQTGESSGKGKRRGFGHFGLRRTTEKLNLTDEQKTQVEQITEASRSTIEPLVEAMKANRQQLQELTAKGQFDEAQVQTVAAERGSIAARLIVEKERVKSQIFQILTDEQRAQGAQMQERMKERFKDRGGRFGGENF